MQHIQTVLSKWELGEEENYKRRTEPDLRFCLQLIGKLKSSFLSTTSRLVVRDWTLCCLSEMVDWVTPRWDWTLSAITAVLTSRLSSSRHFACSPSSGEAGFFSAKISDHSVGAKISGETKKLKFKEIDRLIFQRFPAHILHTRTENQILNGRLFIGWKHRCTWTTSNNA